MSEISYQQAVEQIKEKLDIVDVVSKYVVLKKTGSNYQGICPFHNEKTPSFVVSGNKQIFKCFGCGESGNVITFIMKLENVDFLTAVEILCKNCGMQMPSNADNEEMQRKKRERDKIYQILKSSTEFYHNNLKK